MCSRLSSQPYRAGQGSGGRAPARLRVGDRAGVRSTPAGCAATPACSDCCRCCCWRSSPACWSVTGSPRAKPPASRCCASRACPAPLPPRPRRLHHDAERDEHDRATTPAPAASSKETLKTEAHEVQGSEGDRKSADRKAVDGDPCQTSETRQYARPQARGRSQQARRPADRNGRLMTRLMGRRLDAAGGNRSWARRRLGWVRSRSCSGARWPTYTAAATSWLNAWRADMGPRRAHLRNGRSATTTVSTCSPAGRRTAGGRRRARRGAAPARRRRGGRPWPVPLMRRGPQSRSRLLLALRRPAAAGVPPGGVAGRRRCTPSGRRRCQRTREPLRAASVRLRSPRVATRSRAI